MSKGIDTSGHPGRQVSKNRVVGFIGSGGETPIGYANRFGDWDSQHFVTSSPEQGLKNMHDQHREIMSGESDVFLQLETADYQAGGPKTRVKGKSGKEGRAQRAADFNRDRHGIE